MVKVGIIGGSIGGLTAACLLKDKGLAKVEIFERSHSELEQRGAGIGFLEAASRYLKTFAKIDLDDISVGIWSNYSEKNPDKSSMFVDDEKI